MGLWNKALSLLNNRFGSVPAAADSTLPNETVPGSSETGTRATPEDRMRYLYRQMWIDTELRATILDIRRMDRIDGRVKRIHARVARDTIKGGLVLQQPTESGVIKREWDAFQRRLQLNRVEKLKSDVRGLIIEGNLPVQWVLDGETRVAAAIRMPAETIRANVDEHGRFADVARAYSQWDFMTGRDLADFPLWQLTLARFDPDNFDDMGSMGRPFLDASRTTWKKLVMSDEDLVIRRKMRAPLRMAHVLEGASKEELEAYRKTVEQDQAKGVTTDYYLNRKGGVSPIQGDANLDQIGDVVYLLDSFFSGSPLPKGLMGYADKLPRDVLEDLKRDYYDEVDVIQDTASFVYDTGFRLHLLLQGINPDADAYKLTFAERRTETPTQTTDRALKLKALGLPQGMVWEELGYDPANVEQRRKWESANLDPYPEPPAGSGQRVSITPGNGRKGESGTSVSNG